MINCPNDKYYLVGCLKLWRKFIEILWTTLSSILSIIDWCIRLYYFNTLFWPVKWVLFFDWRNSSTLNDHFCVEIIKFWGKKHIKHDLVLYATNGCCSCFSALGNPKISTVKTVLFFIEGTLAYLMIIYLLRSLNLEKKST